MVIFYIIFLLKSTLKMIQILRSTLRRLLIIILQNLIIMYLPDLFLLPEMIPNQYQTTSHHQSHNDTNSYSNHISILFFRILYIIIAISRSLFSLILILR